MGAGDVGGQKLPPKGPPSNSTRWRTVRGAIGTLVRGALLSSADMLQVVGCTLLRGQKLPGGQGSSTLGLGQ